MCSVAVHISKSCTDVNISDCEVKTTYYGLLVLQKNVRITLSGTTFTDVPKPLLLSRALDNDDIVEEDSSYILTREYTTSQDYKTLVEEMNLHLATSENLPHRTAYDRDTVKLLFKYDALGYTE